MRLCLRVRTTAVLFSLVAVAGTFQAAAAQENLVIGVLNRGKVPSAPVQISAIVNAGKQAVTQTDSQGRASLPLDLLNLGKGTRVRVTLMDCEGDVEVILVPAGEPTPEDPDCDFYLLGVILWGEASVVIDIGSHTVAQEPLATDGRRSFRPGPGSVWVGGFGAVKHIDAEEACTGIEQFLEENPAFSGTCEPDRTSFTGGGFLGVALAPFLAVEGGYDALGSISVSSQASAIAEQGEFALQNDGFFNPKGWFVRAMVVIPLRRIWIMPFGGLLFWTADSGSETMFQTPEGMETFENVQEDSGTDVTAGLRLAVRVNRYLALFASGESVWLNAEEEGQGPVDEQVSQAAFGLMINLFR